MKRSDRRVTVDKEGRISFVTFFPVCENMHLTKDVGMIPYVLHRDFGYDASVACRRNGDYPYLETETPGLKMTFIGKSRLRELAGKGGGFFSRAVEALSATLEVLPFMIRHGRHIDILQLYHYKDESIIAAWIYKAVNPKGIVYLKLDLHPDIIELCKKDPGKVKSSKLYEIAHFDMISTEFSESLDVLKNIHPSFKKYRDSLYYVPNGIDGVKLARFRIGYDKKENIIIHAGRIGTPQKATDVVLRAFAGVAKEFPSWRLLLIGSMDETFEPYYRDFLEKNGEIKDQIQYPGYMESRDDVYRSYQKASVVFFPSRFESFGLVAVEAGYLGDVLLASNIPPIRDITDGGRYGYLCEVDDVGCFIEKLRHIMASEVETAGMSASSATHIGEAFDWSAICAGLHRMFTERTGNR
jgi:glycosyltransferase involved in cell wall biosynthesis